MAIKISPDQGFLFEVDTASQGITAEAGFGPSDFDSPATSLEDYYGTLASAVKSLGRARSNRDGFPLLSRGSEPVREYAYRLEVTPEEARRTVAATDQRHRTRAQFILNRQNKREYEQLHAYAKATGAFTTEQVFDQISLPPSIDELEARYFTDPGLASADLAKKRQTLYRRAKRYKQASTIRVA